MNNVSQYIHFCTELLRLKPVGAHVVTGNSGADLDSVVCSLCYGMLLQKKSKEFYIPVIPRSVQGFHSRQEVIFLLKKVGIPVNHLIFLNKGKLPVTPAGVVLTDHNRLEGALRSYPAKVTAIIDHHFDEGRHMEANPRIIQPVASCSSLVAHEIFLHCPYLMDEQTAFLLLAALAFDTAGLDEKDPRLTAFDRDVAKKLTALAKIQAKDLYKILKNKQDQGVKNRDITSLLDLDYKHWRIKECEVGISSLPVPAQHFLDRQAEIYEAVLSHVKKYRLDIFLCMHGYREKNIFRRDLGIWCKEKEVFAKVLSFFQNAEAGLIPLEQYHELFFYVQEKTTLSRKKLRELFQEF